MPALGGAWLRGDLRQKLIYDKNEKVPFLIMLVLSRISNAIFSCSTHLI